MPRLNRTHSTEGDTAEAEYEKDAAEPRTIYGQWGSAFDIQRQQ